MEMDIKKFCINSDGNSDFGASDSVCAEISDSDGTSSPPMSHLSAIAPIDGVQDALSDFLVHMITKKIMGHLEHICSQRSIKLNMEYWERCTISILRGGTLTEEGPELLVVPARAGSGKSTWILAFILAMCEIWRDDSSLADALGGVVLVCQKVADLNDIALATNAFCQDMRSPPMVALQSWSQSGAELGYCVNKEVSTYDQCNPARCPYSDDCQLQLFSTQAPSAFIVGMTQARFSMLSTNGQIGNYLKRQGGVGKCPIDQPRRFLIFDEKYILTERLALTKEVINLASNEIETLISRQNVPDIQVSRLQSSFGVHVGQRFDRMRRKHTMFVEERYIVDEPLGICTWLDQPNSDDRLKQFYADCKDLFSNMPPNLAICLGVMQILKKKDCFFDKREGFTITALQHTPDTFAKIQRVIFDATAEVDGDYTHMSNMQMLEGSPALHMNLVNFYIYDCQEVNPSKQAMEKDSQRMAFCALVDEIVQQFPAKTFLCGYQRYSTYIMEHISSETRKMIVPMPKLEKQIPYFNGTNGSNQFNRCANVILLGYPRLTPSVTLEMAYAAWGDTVVRDEIIAETTALRARGYRWTEKDLCLPSVQRYESQYLAARCEQEIYRCALRNPQCDTPIRIFLFRPPAAVWKLLESRFYGAEVHHIKECPLCVQHHKAMGRSYNNGPTSYGKLALFLENTWAHNNLKVSELREATGISESVWKDLRKDTRTKALMARHGMHLVGKGAAATLCYQTPERVETRFSA